MFETKPKFKGKHVRKLRIIAPHTLEDCLKRLDNLKSRHHAYLDYKLRPVDDDHTEFIVRLYDVLYGVRPGWMLDLGPAMNVIFTTVIYVVSLGFLTQQSTYNEALDTLDTWYDGNDEHLTKRKHMRVAALRGYFKRWEQTSTLIVARQRQPLLPFLIPAAVIIACIVLIVAVPNVCIGLPALVIAIMQLLLALHAYQEWREQGNRLLFYLDTTFGYDDFEKSNGQI